MSKKLLFALAFILFGTLFSGIASACIFDSDCPNGYFCNLVSHACSTIPDTQGPDSPSLLVANNAESNETISLQWGVPADNGNSGTSSTYHLQISNASDFSVLIFDQNVQGNNFNFSQYGAFYWHVKAKDNEGNWGPYSETRNFSVYDITPPIISVLSPENTTYTKSNIWFNATANEQVNSWIVNYNGTNLTIPINSLLAVNNGLWQLLLYANDTSNNWGSNNSIWFTVNACIPNLQNTSWGDWSNFSECRINDTYLEVRNLTQYDDSGCGAANSTFYDYRESGCNYCSYNFTNTTWNSWQNQTSCQANNTILQNRSKTEYDSNYSTCYQVTLLPSDLWNSGNNNTYWEFQEIGCDYDGAPDLQIISPANINYMNATILLNISANDSTLDKIWYNWNETNYTYTVPLNITFNEGSNILTAWANDSLGNLNSTTVSFTIIIPEVKVNSINIYEASQESEYVEQQNSTISTNITYNLAGNLTIRFLVNGTEKENKTVSFSNETKIVNFSWITEAGSKNINISIDAVANEINLTNNWKNNTISVKGIDEVLSIELIAPYSNGSSYCIATGAYSDFAPIPQELWQNLSVQDQDKVFDYAAEIKKKSGIGTMSASQPEQQQCSPPMTGNKTVWVILAEFNDTNHSMTDCDGGECTPQYWQDKLFNETLTERIGLPWAQTNRTMRNFYKEASYNQLFINGTIVNMSWAKLNNTMGYYAGRQCELLRDAVVAMDPWFDFSAYNDSSTNITIQITHAGDGWETTNTSDPNLIWSLSLSSCSPYATADGKIIQRGTITPESEAGNYKSFGTCCHELGHQLGMPDLYDTGGGGSVVSAWDSMADDYSGNLTEGCGSVPNYFGAWNVLLKGWTNPQIILPGSIANVTLVDHSATNGTRIIKVPIKNENSTEYFLLETRVNSLGIFDYKYGSAILQDGIIIWHIDDSQGSIGINNINTNNGFVNYKRVLIEDKNDTGYVNNLLYELRNAAFIEGFKFVWNNSGHIAGVINDSTNSSMRDPANKSANGGGPVSGVNVYNIVRDGNSYNATIKNSLLPNATFKAALNITSNANISLENVVANISCDAWLSCPSSISINISANGNKIQRINITTNETNYSDGEFKQINASVYGKLNATEKVLTSTGNDSGSANPGAPLPEQETTTPNAPIIQYSNPDNINQEREDKNNQAADFEMNELIEQIEIQENRNIDNSQIITSSTINNNPDNRQEIKQFLIFINLLLLFISLGTIVVIKRMRRN